MHGFVAAESFWDVRRFAVRKLRIERQECAEHSQNWTVWIRPRCCQTVMRRLIGHCPAGSRSPEADMGELVHFGAFAS